MPLQILQPEPTQPDIYSYGFDKQLYRITEKILEKNPLIYNSIEDTIVSSLLTSGPISGDLTLTGIITLSKFGHIKGGQTDYNTGVGFFLGYSTDAYKFSVGNPAADYMAWDGSNLIISGAGVDSNAGDVLLASADTERTDTATSYTKKKEIVAGDKGKLRIKFDLKTIVISDTGFKFPTDTGDLFNFWTNPTNAYADDGANTSSANVYQDYSVFGFSVPATATIDGIELVVQIKATPGNDNMYFTLSYNGGSNWTADKNALATNVLQELTLGGATDTWGRSWSPSEFSNANFFVKAGGTASGETWECDYIKIKVYYTYAGTAYGRVYRNAVAVGTEQTDTTGAYVTKSEDISGWKRADLIQLYVKTSDAAFDAYVRNFRVYNNDWTINTN